MALENQDNQGMGNTTGQDQSQEIGNTTDTPTESGYNDDSMDTL